MKTMPISINVFQREIEVLENYRFEHHLAARILVKNVQKLM